MSNDVGDLTPDPICSWPLEEQRSLVLQIQQAATAEARNEGIAGLYDRCARPLAAFIQSRVFGHMQDAEEIAQRSWIKVIEQIDRYEASEVPLMNWLRAVAENQRKEYFRELGFVDTLSLDDLFERMGFEPAIERAVLGDPGGGEISEHRTAYWSQIASDYSELVRQFVSRLSELKRRAFVMRHQQGFNATQIGTMLGISAGTIRVMNFRTMKALTRFLSREKEGRYPSRTGARWTNNPQEL